jgi:hypothetical protein
VDAGGAHYVCQVTPKDVMQEHLAERKFPRVAIDVEARSVHRVREACAGVQIGKIRIPPAPGVPNALSDEPKMKLGKGLIKPSEKAVSTRNTLPYNPAVGGRRQPL